MKCARTAAAIVATALAATSAAYIPGALPDTIYIIERIPGGYDSLGRSFIILEGDTLHTSFIPDPFKAIHSGPLTDDDYREVATALGVETAAIKAVVEVETGANHTGFHSPDKPLVNFDSDIFRRRAAKRGIDLSAHSGSPALKSTKDELHNWLQTSQQERLDAAMAIDSIAAIEATFWGMFQIGGFNWKLCGTPSHSEFVYLMSRSEYDQLRLFADFLLNTGLVKYLKTRNWATFARYYNGPSYAKRGYHSRLAAAYAKHRKKETKNSKNTLR